MKSLIFALTLLFLVSCGPEELNGLSSLQDSDQINDYAKGFRLDGMNNILYSLNQDGTVSSSLSLDTGSSIERIIVLNTPALSFLKQLELMDKVVGVANKNRISNNVFDIAHTQEVGNFSSLNMELIMAMNPDLIICNAYQRASLSSLDCPVFEMSEYNENHPLGKLEWIKALSAIFSVEQRGDSLFKAIEGSYLLVKNQNKEVCDELFPVSMLSRMSGEYYSSKGSEFAQYIDDACSYWQTRGCDANGACKLSAEEAKLLAYESEYIVYLDWKKEIGTWESVVQELALPLDSKFNIIYSNTLKTSYFEKAIVEPDEVLKNFTSIIWDDADSTTYFTLLKP